MIHSKAKTILHPVRMKILQSLINGKQFTAQQLVERMKDVPQATLYRHLNKLLDEEIIEVVQENQIRGTVEKVFAIKELAIRSQEELNQLSKEEHLDLFLTFTTQLLGLYESYLNGKFDLFKDGVTYRVATLHLTDEESMELTKEIRDLIVKAMENEPSPERRARNFANIIIPEQKKHSD